MVLSLQDGRTVTADAVIVSVPLPVLPEMKFDPPLSEEKQKAMTMINCEAGAKIVLLFEKDGEQDRQGAAAAAAPSDRGSSSGASDRRGPLSPSPQRFPQGGADGGGTRFVAAQTARHS